MTDSRRRPVSRRTKAALLGCAVLLSALPACVRRTATFTTVPEGAHVFLNDREIGRTPATAEFTWYGDYDVVYRLEGHETVHTNVVLKPPLYERFPIDFFAEVLWPGDLHDHHDVPTQTLTPAQTPTRAELIERAQAFRNQALRESDKGAEENGR